MIAVNYSGIIFSVPQPRRDPKPEDSFTYLTEITHLMIDFAQIIAYVHCLWQRSNQFVSVLYYIRGRLQKHFFNIFVSNHILKELLLLAYCKKGIHLITIQYSWYCLHRTSTGAGCKGEHIDLHNWGKLYVPNPFCTNLYTKSFLMTA